MARQKIITWIVVCDGAQARIFSHGADDGDGLAPVSESEHPAARAKTSELGTDRPGRVFDSGPSGGRHAMAPRADWQRAEKEKFAREIAERLTRSANDGEYDRLVIVAPDRVLGDLRKLLSAPVRERLAAEMDKDLTNLSPHELAPRLADVIKL